MHNNSIERERESRNQRQRQAAAAACHRLAYVDVFCLRFFHQNSRAAKIPLIIVRFSQSLVMSVVVVFVVIAFPRIS